MIYWFTGQPGAGKTVLSTKLKEHLKDDEKIFHVDGDDLRNVFGNKNYNKDGRIENIIRAQNISKYLSHQGHTVIVSLVSPYLELRESFKKDMGIDIIEIYVHTKDVRGREHFHTDEYQKPETNYIDLDTTGKKVLQSLDELLNKIKLYEFRKQGLPNKI